MMRMAITSLKVVLMSWYDVLVLHHFVAFGLLTVNLVALNSLC